MNEKTNDYRESCSKILNLMLLRKKAEHEMFLLAFSSPAFSLGLLPGNFPIFDLLSNHLLLSQVPLVCENDDGA